MNSVKDLANRLEKTGDYGRFLKIIAIYPVVTTKNKIDEYLFSWEAGQEVARVTRY